MTEYIRDPGGCVGCPPGMGCLGVDNCPQCVTAVTLCDICGVETDGQDICADCVQENEPIVKDNPAEKGEF